MLSPQFLFKFRNTFIINLFSGKFTCLEVVFKFKRRLGYYLFHTYVPTCLIVIMSWISFWIKPEAVPARVTLGVTSLLTLSTQHANSQKSLPPVSYIKAIDVFMSGCTVSTKNLHKKIRVPFVCQHKVHTYIKIHGFFEIFGMKFPQRIILRNK